MTLIGTKRSADTAHEDGASDDVAFMSLQRGHDGPSRNLSLEASQPPSQLSPHEHASQPHGSQPQQETSQDESIFDDDGSEEMFVARNVPRSLRNLEEDIAFPFETHSDAAFQMPHDALRMMHSASKCFLVEETQIPMNAGEGYTLTFCVPSIGTEIPELALKVAHLFLRIKNNLDLNLDGYVVPTEMLTPVYNGNVAAGTKPAPKCMGITKKSKVFGSTAADDSFGIQDVFAQFASEMSEDASEQVNIPAITISFGFTGCTYDVPNEGVDTAEEKRRPFCLVFVNFAPNLDLFGFMQNKFFVLPNAVNSFKDVKYTETQGNIQTLVKILQHECGMLNSDADPRDWMHNYFGTLGLVTICNPFMVPLKILATVTKETPSAKNIRITGFPLLRFSANDNLRNYNKYMIAYLKAWQGHQILLEENIKKYGACKPEEKADFTASLSSAGGWPILEAANADGRTLFTRFSSYPPVPIRMSFEVRINVLNPTTDGLRANGAGIIPRLVEFVLRRFLGGGEVDAETNAIEESIFLSDRRPRTPENISSQWYGSDVDPLDAIARPGYLSSWWDSISALLFRQRTTGAMDVARACNTLDSHLRNALQSHKGALVSDFFHSARISQGGQWLLNYESGILNGVEIGPFFRQVSGGGNVPEVCRPDINSRIMFFFLCIVSDLNRNMKLNSLNLRTWVDLLVCENCWMLGETKSFPAGFMAGMQIMGGAGHFRILSGGKSTTLHELISRMKNNSTGGDLVKELVNALYTDLGTFYGASPLKNMQLIVNANKWTDGAMQSQSSAEVVDGVVVGLPDSTMSQRPMSATEMRGNQTSYDPLIQNVFPRDAGTNFGMTTQDPDKTNKRVTALKCPANRPQLLLICTNREPADAIENEQTKTLLAVTHCQVPGADAYHPITVAGSELNDVPSDQFTGRSRRLEEGPRKSLLIKCLAQSHMTTCIMSSLLHKSGVVPFEIPESIMSFLDWMFFYLKHWVKPILGKGVASDLSRLITGYTARHVSLSGWLSTLQEMLHNEKSFESVVFKTNKRMILCCLPTVQVGPCFVRLHNYFKL